MVKNNNLNLDPLNIQLKKRLEGLVKKDRNYWSFKGNSKREHGHGFFQYPAMMVPQMVRSVLDEICSVHTNIKNIGDPFSGSGTILTESMLRGLNFFGRDINPLAILLCKAKMGPFYSSKLQDKIEELNYRIDNDIYWRIDIDFPGRMKWFKRDVQISLSRIRRAIIAEPKIWARRFFWIGLAEAVRSTCNSRTSTFKLHSRTTDDIESRVVDPVAIFRRAIERNLEHLRTQESFLEKKKLLENGQYLGVTEISLCDARSIATTEMNTCDLIITSPPYGDNASTVPYGQYSYLPLHWIDLADIDTKATEDFLTSTHEIDFRSLGGSRVISNDQILDLMKKSVSFQRLISKLKSEPKDRTQRVTAFFRDLDFCLAPILSSLRPGGIMVWTLGNRKVGGNRVNFDKILTELLASYGAKLLTSLKRKISSKRMAYKNSVAETMSTETILVMRKAF